MSNIYSSSLLSFLTTQRRRTKGGHSATNEPVNIPTPVSELVTELAALETLQQRNMLLDERKHAPKYNSMFKDAEAPAHQAAAASMEIDAPTAPQQGQPVSDSSPAAAVTFNLMPEFKVVANNATSLKAVISLKATAEVVKPANVALVAVVDKSGSMKGSKIELVKGTVDFLADQLAAQDALALVTYSDQAKRNLPMLMMTPAAKVLAKSVNNGVKVDGCTALHDGLLLAIKEHSSDAAAGEADNGRRVRSVFLCTDGLPNVGPSDAMSIVSAMRAQLAPLTASEQPVSIHTFGFGSDHDPKLLQAIAEAGGGIYYYIQDDKQIPEAFGDALGGLLSVVASNMRISVTAVSGAAGEGACSIAKVESGGVLEAATGPGSRQQACIKFADLFAEESREVQLQLELGQATADGETNQQLIKVDVSYTDPINGAVSSSSQLLHVTRSPSPPAEQQRDPLVAATAARFQVAEAVKAAGAESEAGRYDAAEEVLDQARRRLQQAGAGDEEQAFVAQLQDMSNAVKAARRAVSRQAQAAAYTSMNAFSNAMVQQRSAAVGLTSFVPQASAQASFAFGGMAPPAAAPMAGDGGFPAGFVPVANGPPGAPPPAPGSASGWASSNAMRKKMTSSAAYYVAKRTKTEK